MTALGPPILEPLAKGMAGVPINPDAQLPPHWVMHVSQLSGCGPGDLH